MWHKVAWGRGGGVGIKVMSVIHIISEKNLKQFDFEELVLLIVNLVD